jgi:hypothetical protein
MELEKANSCANWSAVLAARRARDGCNVQPSPCEWTGEHVGRVMARGFEALANESGSSGGPRSLGGERQRFRDSGAGSPTDRLARSEVNRTVDRNKVVDEARTSTRSPLTCAGQALIDVIFSWLAILAETMRLALRDFMMVEAKGQSFARFCDRRGKVHDDAVALKDRALALIAFDLNRRRQPVFS